MINKHYCICICNATQRNATQRNATQRKPKLYLLKNNYFKFLFQKYFLNLVKSFLTSIKFTFDSLSERNLCLVIKKLHQKEIFKMKILKTKNFFTYLVVGL